MKYLLLLLFILGCSHHDQAPRPPLPDPDFKPEEGKPMPKTDSWGWIEYWNLERYGGVYPSVSFVDPHAGSDVVDRIKLTESLAIGYLSIGSAEPKRDDYDQLRPYAPKKMSGWNERWLDLNQMEYILPVMKQRLDRIKALGFDGVYYDNFDVHGNYKAVSQEVNERYALELLNYSRSIGLKYVGINNGLKMLSTIGKYFDFHINESCFVYSECWYFDDMVKLMHPVFHIEYKDSNCKPHPGHSVKLLDHDLVTEIRHCE